MFFSCASIVVWWLFRYSLVSKYHSIFGICERGVTSDVLFEKMTQNWSWVRVNTILSLIEARPRPSFLTPWFFGRDNRRLRGNSINGWEDAYLIKSINIKKRVAEKRSVTNVHNTFPIGGCSPRPASQCGWSLRDDAIPNLLWLYICYKANREAYQRMVMGFFGRQNPSCTAPDLQLQANRYKVGNGHVLRPVGEEKKARG